MVTVVVLQFSDIEFESRCGQEYFHFVILGSHSSQLEFAHINEIKDDIQLANTLF